METAKSSPHPFVRKPKRIYKDKWPGLLFISPFFLLFAVFGLIPMLFSFYLAFFSWNGLGPMTFTGIENFRLVLEDALFWKSLSNTFIIGVMGTLPQLIIGIFLAYALNSTLIRFRNVFRVAVFIPYVTSIVAVAVIFGVLFSNQTHGLVNSILIGLGYDAVSFTTSEWGAKIAISLMIFWRWIGYNTLIYLAGMQSIPKELYEAAKMDGASIWSELRYVVIPMLKPFIIFTVFTATIGALQVFTEPLVFLGRSLREEGITIVAYLYRDAFMNNFFGTASATAVMLFILIMIITCVNLLLTNQIGRSTWKGGPK
ncbi:carbohydrate ABC transporter permease [Shouchella tritolerans]|uniref:carbohydrate ABC transporter permease n=1 Tax=Shouchella tritolerans TaxID=2979466 RepID=UPI00078684B5|nr:sugar ABC transporter permease [Shouchella tritolerans]